MITRANGEPCLAPLGALTGAATVRPALTGTTWLSVTLAPPRLAGAISVSRTCAPAPGADSRTEAVMPSPLVLPATTACSLIGAVAAVSTPGPALPGTTTEAATGTSS